MGDWLWNCSLPAVILGGCRKHNNATKMSMNVEKNKQFVKHHFLQFAVNVVVCIFRSWFLVYVFSLKH